jgi:hypothetical protein
MTPERTVQVLEYFKHRVCADTGMSMRDLECLLHLIETGSFTHEDLLPYGINVYTYAPQG